MHFDSIRRYYSLILVYALVTLPSSCGVCRLSIEVKEHLSHLQFLRESLISIVAPIVMIVPHSDNRSLLSKRSIV